MKALKIVAGIRRRKRESGSLAFVPTSISNLLMWYDMSDSATVTRDKFGNTTDVADKSGNALHVSNVGGGTSRPIYLTAALNGLNTLQFTAATSQNLRRAKVTELQGISGLSIFHVGGKLGAAVFHGFDLNNRTQVLSDFTDNKSYSIIANGSGSFLSNSTGAAGYQRWDTIFDGSQSGNSNRLKSYLNSTLQTITYSGTIPATTESNASSKFGIGVIDLASPIYTGGEIAEILIYTRALNDTERGLVQSYLSTKWAL